MPDAYFKRCAVCGQTWLSAGSFIADPAVRLVGLQAVPAVPQANVVVFLHEGCGSVSVKTSALWAVLGNELPEAAGALGSTEPCDGCYRDLTDLAGCRKPCVIARDRRLTLHILKKKS